MNRITLVSASLVSAILFGIFPQLSLAAGHICNAELNLCMVTQNEIIPDPDTIQKETPEQNLNLEIGGDLSDEGEKRYVSQIRKWLATLPEAKRKPALAILQESHKELQALRKAIYNKKTELAAVCFDDKSSLSQLPRLGMDLQNLRRNLREKLELINARLLNEAGIKMDALTGEGLWLQPLPKSAPQSRKAHKLDYTGKQITLLEHMPPELQ